MSIDMTKCRLSKSGNIILPKGRILYPVFFEPRAVRGDEKGEPKFGCSILMPKSADLALAVEEVMKVAREKHGDPSKIKLKKPFLKTEDQPKLAEYADEYSVLIRVANKYKVQVVGPDLRPITDEEAVYSGRWGIVSVKPFAWAHPTGGKGVSFSMEAVQLLDHADRMAGGGGVSAEDEFEAVAVAGDAGASGGGASAMFD